MTEHAATSTSNERQEHLKVASQAAALQDRLLQELLAMADGERQDTLRRAARASQDFLEGALQLPPGPQRIAYMRQVDPATQRLLLLHKLWQGRSGTTTTNGKDQQKSTEKTKKSE